MTSLLAIDAATEACSVAVSSNGKRWQAFKLLPRAHTQFLLPMIDEQLRAAGISLAELNGIAFTAGPGSFTGLRIGCAVVQGLAYAAELPVLPVSTLHAMAQHAIGEFSIAENEMVYPILDARMGEVYAGAYQQRGGIAVAVAEDRLCKPEQVSIGGSGPGRNIAIGSGWQYADAFSISASLAMVETAFYPHAGALLCLASALQGQMVAADQAQPVYLRDSVAWQKQTN